MPDNNVAILENERYSIREFASGTYGGLVGDGFGIWYPGESGMLSAWGTYACDRELRAFHYMLHNQLWSGAHDIYQQKVLSTPFEISGGRNLTFKWQDIFLESEFGQGYDELLAPCLTDYLTLNRGMFIEIVSYGDPDTPLKDGARVLGLNHLDALRIVFTGNLEYPFIYYSEETNKAHRLHRTRVIHLTHSPSPDTRMFGMGRSPLYSALSSVNAQILLGRHQNEMLNDLPPPGLIIFTNVKGEDVRNAMTMFEAQRRKEGQSVYRAPMQIEGKDPAQPVTVTFTPLSQVPADFDRQKYMEIDVNLMALNTQLDPQDLWPLMGQQLGAGTQSKVLATKTQVKGPGYLLTRLERAWNRITPRPLEFKYKAQNAEQDRETADIAKTWTDTINAATYLSDVEKRQMAANQIPAFADVLFDEAGNVRLPDDDPKTPAQETAINEVEDTTLDDTVQADTATDPAEDTTADDVAQLSKEYDATKTAFTSDIAAILQDAADGGVSKAAFSARMRSTINTYGKAAYLDGLETGGVGADSLDGDDSDIFAGLLAEQSVYVSDIANRLYKDDGSLIGNADYNANLWTQKSLSPFYNAGLVSADKNGIYEWVEGDTVDKCSDCLRMDGQKHRIKEYRAKDMMPPTSKTDCGGWNCGCSLKKASGKASGNW
jgi:hypothetical protein